jgi:hypothetical protein
MGYSERCLSPISMQIKSLIEKRRDSLASSVFDCDNSIKVKTKI